MKNCTLNFLQTCEKHPSFPVKDVWQDITNWTVYPVEDMQFDPEIESFRHSTFNYFTDLLLENARPVPGYWSEFPG